MSNNFKKIDDEPIENFGLTPKEIYSAPPHIKNKVDENLNSMRGLGTYLSNFINQIGKSFLVLFGINDDETIKK